MMHPAQKTIIDATQNALNNQKEIERRASVHSYLLAALKLATCNLKDMPNQSALVSELERAINYAEGRV